MSLFVCQNSYIIGFSLIITTRREHITYPNEIMLIFVDSFSITWSQMPLSTDKDGRSMCIVSRCAVNTSESDSAESGCQLHESNLPRLVMIF